MYESYQKIVDCHGTMPDKFIMIGETEAEFCKYYNNIYNAMLIIFANSFYEVCEASGVNYTQIKNAIVNRNHINDSYLDCNENLRGFGGMCLPKDLNAFRGLISQLGCDIKLFDTLAEENLKYKTTVFKGMRK